MNATPTPDSPLKIAPVNLNTRWIWPVATSATAVVIGVALGEDVMLLPGAFALAGFVVPLPILYIFLIALLCLVGFLIQLPLRLSNNSYARLWKLLPTVLIAVSFFLSSVRTNNAFVDCIDRGEYVRSALERHKAEFGSYPDALSDLGVDLPGSRILLPDLLKYHSNGSKYELWFQDFLVTHQSTESEEFLAIQ